MCSPAGTGPAAVSLAAQLHRAAAAIRHRMEAVGPAIGGVPLIAGERTARGSRRPN